MTHGRTRHIPRREKELARMLDEERGKTRQLQAEFDVYRQRAQADVGRIAQGNRDLQASLAAMKTQCDELQKKMTMTRDASMADLGLSAFQMLVQTNHALAIALTKGNNDAF